MEQASSTEMENPIFLSVEHHQLPVLPSGAGNAPQTSTFSIRCGFSTGGKHGDLIHPLLSHGWAVGHNRSLVLGKRPNDISLHQNKWKPGIWAPGLMLSDLRGGLLKYLGKKMSYPALRHIARRWDRSWHYTACCVRVSWVERGLQFFGLSVQYSSDALITVLEHNQ